MNDLKTYLESGILELYVLGDLSIEEIAEVENMIAQYPEVRSELEAIENALQAYAISNSLQPPAAARNKVLSSLNVRQDTVARVMPAGTAARPSDFYKYAFAASIALLLVSVILLVDLNNRLKESNSRLASLQSANEQFSNKINYMNRELEDSRKFLEIYQKPGQYKLVSLKGTPKTPEASMKVAFNPVKEEVMIDLSSLSMPSTDNEHQYQLWALVDGKPVDLGVFDYTAEGSGMKKMKPVRGAGAFAVTIEPKGGSRTPTMEEMIAMGYL